MSRERALVLVGSPRGLRSVSNSIADHLLAAIKRYECRKILIHDKAYRNDPASLADSLGSCRAVILIYPLYVDSLPAPVIALMEAAARVHGSDGLRGIRFCAISNCGYPEGRHARESLMICSRFAAETGMSWMGGLSLGGGPTIGVKGLHTGRGKAAAAALDPLVRALEDEAGPSDGMKNIVELDLVNPVLYRSLGNWGWRWTALRRGLLFSMGRRPSAVERGP